MVKIFSVECKLRIKFKNLNFYKYKSVFKICKSVHHHTIQTNQKTRCKNFSSFFTWCLCTAGWPDHDQQHCYHHAPTVKPEAATAVVQLLIMGVRTLQTCWAVHKRHVKKLEKLLHLVGWFIWIINQCAWFFLFSCE